MVVFALGKNILFKSALGHCELWQFQKGFDYIMHSAVVAARGLRNLDDRFDE